MAGGSLELDVTKAPGNRNFLEDESEGLLKKLVDVTELKGYFKTL